MLMLELQHGIANWKGKLVMINHWACRKLLSLTDKELNQKQLERGWFLVFSSFFFSNVDLWGIQTSQVCEKVAGRQESTFWGNAVPHFSRETMFGWAGRVTACCNLVRILQGNTELPEDSREGSLWVLAKLKCQPTCLSLHGIPQSEMLPRWQRWHSFVASFCSRWQQPFHQRYFC